MTEIREYDRGRIIWLRVMEIAFKVSYRIIYNRMLKNYIKARLTEAWYHFISNQGISWHFQIINTEMARKFYNSIMLKLELKFIESFI